MQLSRIWTAFFLISFAVCCYKGFWRHEPEAFEALATALLEAAKTAVTISIGLVGVMGFWLGIMKLGEAAGLVEALGRMLSPVLRRIFPGVPAGHPAMGAMIMNFSANMLGLDSAATPLGLEAMRQLQTLNPSAERASNAQAMFTVINTAGLTLIPVSVMVYRAQLGAANPADVFIPCMLGTIISALSGFLIVAALQRINLLALPLLLPLLLVVGGLVLGLAKAATLGPALLGRYSQIGGNFLVVAVVVGFIAAAAYKKLNVYELFVDGAKQGFDTGVRIIPFLIAMLAAVAALRASGVLGYVLALLSRGLDAAGLDTAFVPALPTALMKPLSGAGARGLMLETMKTYGADSFVGKLVSTVQGSTETTFYVLALYYGSVGIKDTRYTLAVGLVVDAIGAVAAILLGYLFFR